MFLRLIIFLLVISVNLLSGTYVNESEKTAISENSEIEDGYVIKVKPEGTAHATKSQKETIKSALRSALDSKGFYEAGISEGKGEELIIEFAEEPENAGDIKKVLCEKMVLTFRDYEGNVLMEGTEEFIRDANMQHGGIYSADSEEYYVSLTFTDKGRETFRAATETVLGYAEEGNNHIAIYLGDTLITMPVVSALIDSDTCIITGSFTEESAATLAAQIRVGLLPFDLECVS